MSENSLFPKTKSIMTVSSSRGGSIPKAAAKEAREFGREITQNCAMATVSQQTTTIMQGKLKPNVSHQMRASRCRYDANQLHC